MSKFLCAVIFLATIVFCGNCSSTNKKCVQQNSCLCRLDEFHKIDISSILDKYPYLADTFGNFTYYFLGCEDKEFEKNKSIKASLIKGEQVQIHNNSSNSTTTTEIYTVIGNASSIKFEYDSNVQNFLLVYNETGNSTSTVPIVRLFCQKFTTPFLNIFKVDSNELGLTSPTVCEIQEHHGLSGGTIFLIILFVSAGIYFFGGAIFLYFIRGARDIEMIPNIDFWRNLPGLVKDGVIFLLSGCKPTYVSTAETYDRI